VVLLFFGYTYCPDVCPATLGEIREVFQSLGGRAVDVDFVFITIDPQRDTAESLGRHLAAFDERFIGLSGSEQALAQIYLDYGVYISRSSESEAGYLLEHNSQIFVIDRAGNLRETFPFGVSAATIQRDLEVLLAEPADGFSQ